jgi:hypothetical protein
MRQVAVKLILGNSLNPMLNNVNDHSCGADPPKKGLGNTLSMGRAWPAWPEGQTSLTT